MTAAEARDASFNAESGEDAMRWRRAADALEQYEREAEARAGMPELRCPWRVVDREGEEWRQGYTKEVMLREDHLTKLAASYPKDAPFRLVRLAVVEVVEPEPPRPVREVQPSGFWYRRAAKSWGRTVEAMVGDEVAFTVIGTLNDQRFIPPADRALVARLLGEVG